MSRQVHPVVVAGGALVSQLPVLKVRGPEGQQFSVELVKDRTTVGRLSDFNNVALEPDPQQFVTRKIHCAVERDAGAWWVVDNGSVNRTFVQRGEAVELVNGRAPLGDCDVIRILAELTESGEPLYWQLTFRDPQGTRRAHRVPQREYLRYDWIQAKLFRSDGPTRQEIRKLRPQEHKLIRYMDQRNRANGNVPVMCTFEELMTAIWDEEDVPTKTQIEHLVWELRQKLEPQPNEPQFLQTVPGLGYCLVTSPKTG